MALIMHHDGGGAAARRAACAAFVFNVLCAAAACGGAGGGSDDGIGFESAFTRPIAFIGRDEESYIHALAWVLTRLQGMEDADSVSRALYTEARRQWIGTGYEAADGPDGKRRVVQAAWPRMGKAPPPTIGLASWILALNKKEFGVIGAKKLTWDLAERARQRKGIVFMETEAGYQWVTKMISDDKKTAAVLSTGEVIPCGTNRRADACSCDNLRQWILIFADMGRACLFYNESKPAARSAGIEVFWYPQYLEQYLVAASGGKNKNPLPHVARTVDCEMRKR